MRPTAQIDTCRTSHRRLIDNLSPLTDADFREASRLPRYSRGHLVTHLANKAKAHVAIFEAVAAGDTPRLHPVGYDPDQAASAGAGRSAPQLRADLAGSFEELEKAWDELEAAVWDRQAIMMAGPRTMAEAVDHHLRNVEVHHLDLRIGYRARDWPAVFVETELSKRLRALPDRADHADLLAWLVNRSPAPELAERW